MKPVYLCRRWSVLSAIGCLCLILLSATFTAAQRTEYRGFWVDTFNSALNNHADVVTVVNNAKAAKANVIFAQVRRRGDSWYLNSLEPGPDFVPIAAGFDALADLIATAHADGIEVHAYVIMSAIWSKNPQSAPSATLGPPISDQHVFNRHAWNKATNSMRTGPDNWLTKSLAPFPAAVTFDGQRYGNDFWLDFGHPDAAAYTVDVVMHLVNNYDVDGLHLDRIRYPEFTVLTGQPALNPTNGANVGYNDVSVARFNTRHDRTGVPAQSDNLWKQWRRDQVTNIVRRVYLNAIASKPQLKISGSFIATGNGPICAIGANCKSIWETSIRAEAYWRMYQDWRAWTEEGIIDLAIPMNYKREHVISPASQIVMFDEWNEWTKNQQYGRGSLVGIGNFQNSVEGSLRQTRRSLLPSSQGNNTPGVVFFSMATSDVSVTANPWSIPGGATTPDRPFSDFAFGLTTGKTGAGALLEPNANAPGFEAVFAQPATLPTLQWKFAPTKGHLKGFAKRSDGSALDTATVTIKNLATQATRTTSTDGGGFYGGVDLDPGNYQVKAELGATTLFACSATVSAGLVTTADLTSSSNTPPTTTATVAPSSPDGANGWYVTSPTLTLDGVAGCATLDRTEYSLDGGATWLVYSSPIAIMQEGMVTVLFRSVDSSGTTEPEQSRTFKVDLTAPTAALTSNPGTIFPPSGEMTNVALDGNGADAGSGLSQVSYVVTDEYGMLFSINDRPLSGSSANWLESLAIEASRRGNDRDGRLYTVVATVTDVAGRTSTATATVVVTHDSRGGNGNGNGSGKGRP
ncbi:MAG TPA: family 10 glycosylhydrolase [Pyrinomonadaceae bacterium]|nr:family 10 glycosylhydrolase [Pyrinomonadaceae bacterium]